MKVTFEANAQEVNSKELVPNISKKESQSNAFQTPTAEKLLEINTNSTTSQSLNSTVDKNNSSEKSDNTSDGDKELEKLFNEAEGYVNKHLSSKLEGKNSTDISKKNSKSHHGDVQDNNLESMVHKRKHRKDLDTRKKIAQELDRKKLLEQELNNENAEIEEENNAKEVDSDKINERPKRSQQPINPELLDRGIRHGGNNNNQSDDSESSVSSFENGLLNCYGGNVLLAHEFDPSDKCNDVEYLLSGNKRVQTTHEVAEDGYYYYIFYSDNDLISNDIHAVFEIYKPTLQYENVTKACINKTECRFPLSMTSIDRVIVEVPTRDGIDHEIDDISILVSTCVPRMGIYVIFPIAVLFFVLGCAFL